MILPEKPKPDDLGDSEIELPVVPQAGEAELPISKFPRKVGKAYRILAYGRHAGIWLTELIELYDIYLREEGEHKARLFILGELPLAVWPVIGLRLFNIAYSVHRLWVKYRRVAGD